MFSKFRNRTTRFNAVIKNSKNSSPENIKESTLKDLEFYEVHRCGD